MLFLFPQGNMLSVLRPLTGTVLCAHSCKLMKYYGLVVFCRL